MIVFSKCSSTGKQLLWHHGTVIQMYLHTLKFSHLYDENIKGGKTAPLGYV